MGTVQIHTLFKLTWCFTAEDFLEALGKGCAVRKAELSRELRIQDVVLTRGSSFSNAAEGGNGAAQKWFFSPQDHSHFRIDLKAEGQTRLILKILPLAPLLKF